MSPFPHDAGQGGEIQDACNLTIPQVLNEIKKLPSDLHTAGPVTDEVLEAFVEQIGDQVIDHSIETGSGKSTLLLSHLSNDHKVFALEVYGGVPTRSISGIRDLDVLNAANVEFIEGPTQVTLPRYKFEHKLQLAFLDGPHGYPFPDLEYFFVYPHLEEDALLVVDDIQIATIHHLFEFLQEDEMFRLTRVVGKTAFFRRTSAPTFDPFHDGWWLQKYNKSRFPVRDDPKPQPLEPHAQSGMGLKRYVPRPVKEQLKRFFRINQPN